MDKNLSLLIENIARPRIQNPTGNPSTISTEALDSSACVFYDYDPPSVVAKVEVVREWK